MAWEYPSDGCSGGLQWLGGWSASWFSSGEWSVAVCVCSWWFLSPYIGEGSDRSSGQGYRWFIWHRFLDLDFGCNILIWGEWLHRIVWVDFIE